MQLAVSCGRRCAPEFYRNKYIHKERKEGGTYIIYLIYCKLLYYVSIGVWVICLSSANCTAPAIFNDVPGLVAVRDPLNAWVRVGLWEAVWLRHSGTRWGVFFFQKKKTHLGGNNEVEWGKRTIVKLSYARL